MSVQDGGLDFTLEQLEQFSWRLGGPAIPAAKDPNSLVECSEGWRESFERLGINVPEATEEEIATASGPRWVFDGAPDKLDSALRADALLVAESWAHRNCYLPCAAQMCGEVSSSRLEGHVKVYLRNEGLFRAIERDEIMFGPEALVLISIDSLTAVDAIRVHSGCNRGC